MSAEPNKKQRAPKDANATEKSTKSDKDLDEEIAKMKALCAKKPETPMSDNFRVPEWTESDGAGCVVETSTFVDMFPRAREQYLIDNWENIRKILYPHKIAATLDLVNGSMTVETTPKTWDPFIIIKAHHMIRLLARYVPVEAAARVLRDDTTSTIVDLDLLVPKGALRESRYLKRRQRLVGPHNRTLQVMEVLTECYIGVAGRTLAAIGSFRGVNEVTKIVKAVVADNQHPYYELKRLLVKRELLASESADVQAADWQPYLPQYRKVRPGAAEKDEKKADVGRAAARRAGADVALDGKGKKDKKGAKRDVEEDDEGGDGDGWDYEDDDHPRKGDAEAAGSDDDGAARAAKGKAGKAGKKDVGASAAADEAPTAEQAKAVAKKRDRSGAFDDDGNMLSAKAKRRADASNRVSVPDTHVPRAADKEMASGRSAPAVKAALAAAGRRDKRKQA